MKKLSRDEMKNVMGGVDEAIGEIGGTDKYKCCIGTECTACYGWVSCSSGATQSTC